MLERWLVNRRLQLTELDVTGPESVTCGHCDARPTVIFPAEEYLRLYRGYQSILLGDRSTSVYRTLAQGRQ